VIHHSRWPVLVLRGGEDSWPPERVIFGDDGSEAARAAGDLGASLCGRRGAQALVLHAYPRLPEVDAEDREFDPRLVDDELRRAENDLQERSRELESRLGSRPKARLVVGDAAASLMEAAEADAPERTLLAVGSRDLGAIGRMRLGSVSTKVVHAAKGPVLVHPPTRAATYAPRIGRAAVREADLVFLLALLTTVATGLRALPFILPLFTRVRGRLILGTSG